MTVIPFSGSWFLDDGERVRAAERVLRPTVECALYCGLMRVALAAAAIAIVIAASAFAETSRTGGSKERRFFSARHGVGVDAPPGWALSQHTGYPTVLVALVHPGGSRITLAVDRTTVKDAAALVEQSKPGLLAQGLTIVQTAPGPHDGVQLEARAARQTRRCASSTSSARSRAGPTRARPWSSRWPRRSPISRPRRVRSNGSWRTWRSRRRFASTRSPKRNPTPAAESTINRPATTTTSRRRGRTSAAARRETTVRMPRARRRPPFQRVAVHRGRPCTSTSSSTI